MFIYFIAILLVMFMWIQCYSTSDLEIFENKKKKCCYYAASILVLIAALRGSSVGTDTASYIRDFSLVKGFSYSYILERYADNPGYYLFCKFIADLGVSVQIWFAIIAGLYIYSINKLIRKFSEDPGFSYLLFITMGFYSFSLAGLKQTLAMTFTQLAYVYLFDRKYFRVSIYMLLAVFCHLSSIVFLLALIIHFMKHSKRYYLFLSIISIVWVVGFSTITSKILSFLGNEHYSSYLGAGSESGGTLTMFFVMLLVQLVSSIYMRSYSDNDFLQSRDLFGMSLLGVVMQLLSLVAASAFRIGLYFSVFSIVLLPNCICQEQNTQTRRLLKLGILMTFVFFYWYSNRNGSSTVPYVFFWNE